MPLLAALKHPLAAGGLAPRGVSRPGAPSRTGAPRAAPGAGLCRALARADRRRADGSCAALSTGSKPASATLPDLLAGRRRAARPAGRRAYRSRRAAGGERRRDRRRAAVARGRGRDGGALLPRADRSRAAISRRCLAATIRRCSRRSPPARWCGRLWPASAAGDLGPARGAAAAGRSCRPRRARTRAPGLARPPHDPWMSRQMRREFGIAVPERAIGIAAHDFAQAIAAPGGGADPRGAQRGRADRAVALAAAPRHGAARGRPRRQRCGPDPDDRRLRPTALDRRGRTGRSPPAAPRPPLAARPRKLSVTQIETWLRDPYAIYARHILRSEAARRARRRSRPRRSRHLHPSRRSPISCAVSAPAARGCRAASCWRSGGEHFGAVLSRPGAWAFWWPRFERIARWFVARRGDASPPRSSRASASVTGSLTLPAPGGPFELTAHGRPHRPAGGRRVSADRLQDRLACRARRRSGRLSRRSCRWKARSARRQLRRRQRHRRRRSNIGGSAAATGRDAHADRRRRSRAR